MNSLLDLKLVFVTGKGGVGKTTVASALALLASQRGKRVLICEVDAKGDVAGFYEAPPTGFNEKEILPGLFAMTMDTEASLREYLKLQLRIPVVGRIGPLAKAFDFVATAAPGVREILTVGKLGLRGARAQLRPGGGGRPGLRPHHRPAGRPPGHQQPGQGGADPLPDRLAARHPLGSADHRPGGRVHARGDAGQRDHRAGRAGEGRDHRAAVGGGGQPGPARALRPPGGGGVRRPGVAGPLGAAERAGGRGRRPAARGGPPGRDHAAHPVHPPRPAPSGHRRVGAHALPALPVHPVPRAADHPAGGGVARRGARATDGPAARRRRTARTGRPTRRPEPDRGPRSAAGAARSTGCWPPRRSSSPAARGAWARPPRRRPRR